MPYVQFHAVKGNDPNGEPIQGVLVSSPDNGGWTTEPTNICGDTFAMLSPGQYNITFHKDGYKDAGYYPATIGQEGGKITKGMEPGVNPNKALQYNLVIDGQFFALENGDRFTAIQCSDFNLLNRFQHGEDINPILAQRASLGFNMLRVWTAYDIPGIGTFTDLDYNVIPPFVALCATYGLYVEFCGYTGINNKLHWGFLVYAAKKCPIRPLLELVNEVDQNTNEPDSSGRIFNLADYDKPAGVLTSHGSNGSMTAPVTPYWDYVTFHTNDAPNWWLKTNGNVAPNLPTLYNENTRSDKDGEVTHHYEAAYWSSLLNGGACYHSPNGKISALWQGNEYNCALAHSNGAHQVNLSIRHTPIPNNDTHGLFNSLIAGKPFGQDTLVEISDALGYYGIALTPPNASNDRTKIADPISERWTRVGFGEGYWVWIVQGDLIYTPNKE